MASAIVLEDAPLGRPARGCKCVYNRRTKKSVQLCPVPKSKKHRSGWRSTGPCR